VSPNNISQLAYCLRLKFCEEGLNASERFFLQLELGPFGNLGRTCFQGAFGLFAFVFGLDVGVEGRVGEVPFTAPALVISSFLVFAGSS
jgi:hypothetical protein